MLVSVIIPCREKDNDVQELIGDLQGQVFKDRYEIIVMEGYPASKARNEGARKAKGEILVFIDKDIRLGHGHVLERIIGPLLDEEKIGIAITSLKIPSDANAFEKLYAKQVPLCELPVVNKVTAIGSAPAACLAIKKELFERLGGFHERMIRGEDTEFSLRIRKKGYKIVIVPQTWCYHHPPRNLLQMIKVQIRNGIGAAFIDAFYPRLNMDIHPDKLMYELKNKSLSARISRFIHKFIKAFISLRVLYFTTKLVYGLSYIFGRLKYFLEKAIPLKRCCYE